MDEKPWIPQWLKLGLIEDDFPWRAAQRMNLTELLEGNSLHDSVWINLSLHMNKAKAVAVFRYCWIEFTNNAPLRGDTIEKWPLLLIRLSPILKVQVSVAELEPEDTVMRAASRLITAQEYQQLTPTKPSAGALSEISVSRTDVEDVYGGVITLFHGATVEILCMSYEGSAIPLPS